MRPLEALLLLADLFVFIVVAFPQLRRARWTRYFAVLPPLCAGAQVLVEGFRWQMIPAYLLSISYFLALPWKQARPAGDDAAPVRSRRLIALGGVVLGAIGLLISAVLPVVLPVFQFPHPHGPYEIGTLTYHWVDTSRPEIFTADPSDQRELMVQIWYPAQPAGSATRAPYIEDPTVLAPLGRLLHMPASLFGYLRYVKTSAVPSAPVTDAESRYPVLVFAHGRGGLRQHNTFQVEELVSHGYVVAAIDHPYAASTVIFPDGRRAVYDPRMNDRPFHDSVIPYLAKDVSFTLDQLAVLDQADPNHILTGRLDLNRLGIFGLSMGGLVAAESCHLDPRLRACLVMDVFMPPDVVRSGLRQPTMWISRDAATMQRERWRQADIDEHQTTMRAVYEKMSGDGYLVLVPGMFHQNFSDFPLVIPAPLGTWLGFIGPIDARRGHEITITYSLAFFERYLKGATEPLLDGPAKPYPEVLFSSRGVRIKSYRIITY